MVNGRRRKTAGGVRLRLIVAVALAAIALAPAFCVADGLGAGQRGNDAALPLPPAGSREAPGAKPPDTTSSVRTLGVLSLVVVGVVVALRLVRRFAPSLATNPAGAAIRVVAQTPLGTRGVIYLVRCGPRLLVVGATANQLTTLAEIADADEMEQFDEISGSQRSNDHPAEADTIASSTPDLKGNMDGLLQKIERWKTAR